MRASQLHERVYPTDAQLLFAARQRYAYGVNARARLRQQDTAKRSFEEHRTWNAVSPGGHGLLRSREVFCLSVWTII